MVNPTQKSSLFSLFRKGAGFLGSEYAVMGGAMTWVSESGLVSSISNAGGFGVLACGAMAPDLLEKEIQATQQKLITLPSPLEGEGRVGGFSEDTPPPTPSLEERGRKAPFGVNLIIMHPELEKLIDVCIESKVSHIVLAGGMPKAKTIDKIKSAGIKTMCFAPSYLIGKKLVKMGADALVIEGMEAGGHIGPVSTSVLAQEILPQMQREMPEIPVFVAGGIGRGEAMVSYLEMGAAGIQLGTRFVCAKESIAHPNFKRAFIKASARDAVPSVQLDPELTVIPVRALANKATDEFLELQKKTIEDYRAGNLNKQSAQLKIEHFWAGALRRAVIDGDIEHGSLMAGQSVGMVTREQSVAEIIAELAGQAESYLEGVAS